MTCTCGNEIPAKRVEILKLSNFKLQCITCAEGNVKRKAGFMVRDHKMSGEIQILDQEQADLMYSLSSRAGGLQVSAGVRFHSGKK